MEGVDGLFPEDEGHYRAQRFAYTVRSYNSGAAKMLLQLHYFNILPRFVVVSILLLEIFSQKHVISTESAAGHWKPSSFHAHPMLPSPLVVIHTSSPHYPLALFSAKILSNNGPARPTSRWSWQDCSSPYPSATSEILDRNVTHPLRSTRARRRVRSGFSRLRPQRQNPRH